VLGALVLVLLLWQRPWDGAEPAPDDSPAAVSGEVATELAAQFRALSAAGSEQELIVAAGPGDEARAWATRTWANLRALGAHDVELRYTRGGPAEAFVDVTWTPGVDAGLGAAPIHRVSVAFTLESVKDGYSVQDAHVRSDPLPLWLAGRVTVEATGRARVLRVDGGAVGEVAPLAAAALTQVRGLVPGATGELTVVSPDSAARAAALLGRPPEQLADIAAVTTRLGGAQQPDGPPVVVLNPAVFATMDARAAQVVMTHEATHVLTGVLSAGADAWVVEGFADFVALHDDEAPLSVSAGQVLAEVEADGPPVALPSVADFEGARGDLGAVYESAWMAFRMLGERFDDAAVAGFYTDVRDGAAAEQALRERFGLDLETFTAQWRDYLTKSASTVS